MAPQSRLNVVKSVTLLAGVVGSLAISTETSLAANLSGDGAVSAFSSRIQAPACDLGMVGGYQDCVGSYALGNVGGTNINNDVTDGGPTNFANQILATGVFGGINNWIFDSKDDTAAAGASAPGVGADLLGFQINGLGNTSGTFDLNSFGASGLDLTTTAFAFSLKSARDFSIYYVPAGALTSSLGIDWNTFGVATNNQGNPQAISHASLFYSSTATAVPTPALLPGLIGFGMSIMRKRKQR